MATTSAVSLPLCRLAAETTLSEGLIVILLDQDRYGVHIIVGYTDLSPSSYGLEDVYCRAVERCLEDFRSTHVALKIITARFRTSPRSLNGITMVHSRHAMLIYWEEGVWLYTKSSPASRLN